MIYVNSEIGKLRTVLVHRPDSGIARVSPKRAEELLFDDIVHLPKMQEEHDIFVQVLNAFLGEENVKEIQDLLEESIAANHSHRMELIEWVVDFEELPKDTVQALSDLDDHVLAETLITGYLASANRFLFDPIPNFIFTRDIAVTIKDHILITKAAKQARYRENLLTRFMIYSHPLFKDLVEDDRIINLNDVEKFPPSQNGDRVSVEGGDIMMINDNFLLVGVSERTTEHAFNSIKQVIFDKEIVQNVVQVNIPSDRSCMHIDTLFTRIGEDDVVAYKPTIYDGLSSNVIVHRSSGDKEVYKSVRDFFMGEINRGMKFIFSGDGQSPYQEREQWTDGCNLVALQPTVGITYDRNPYTEEAFKKAGYEVIRAEDLLDKIDSGILRTEEIRNTIITLPSSELSRARGGSHCMTCPVSRDSI